MKVTVGRLRECALGLWLVRKERSQLLMKDPAINFKDGGTI